MTLAGRRIGRGKKEKNWRDDEIELLIKLYEYRACLWDVAHGAETKRILTNGEVAFCQVDTQMPEKIWHHKRRLQMKCSEITIYGREYANFLP